MPCYYNSRLSPLATIAVVGIFLTSSLQDAQAFVPSTFVPSTTSTFSRRQDTLLPMVLPTAEQQETVVFSDDKSNTTSFLQDESSSLYQIEQFNTSLSDEESLSQQPLGIWAARALLLLIAVIWGTNFASVKYLETLCFHPPCVHPPSEAALARFGVAAAVSLPLLVGQSGGVILGGLECGLWISLGYITQAVALSSIAAGKCAFICSLTVVVVPLLSAILYGKPIKGTNLAAAAVALSGVAILEGLVDVNALVGVPPALADTGLMASSGSSSVETASAAAALAGPLGSVAKALGVGKGDIVALGQPIGFGLAFMRIEHYVEKFKNVPNRVLTLSAAQCVTVGLISLAWVLYDFHGTIPNMGYMLDPHRVAAIAWTGIVTTVVAIYLEGVALETATATDAALTFASEPVWASIFGVWLLHEHLNMNAYVGGAIILIACLLGAASDLPGPAAETGELKSAFVEEESSEAP